MRVSEALAAHDTVDADSGPDAGPISQEILIKMMARLHPTLRWLRSDLTPDNVVMLHQERPDIVFC